MFIRNDGNIENNIYSDGDFSIFTCSFKNIIYFELAEIMKLIDPDVPYVSYLCKLFNRLTKEQYLIISETMTGEFKINSAYISLEAAFNIFFDYPDIRTYKVLERLNRIYLKYLLKNSTLIETIFKTDEKKGWLN
jgi:hypothetical protein